MATFTAWGMMILLPGSYQSMAVRSCRVKSETSQVQEVQVQQVPGRGARHLFRRCSLPIRGLSGLPQLAVLLAHVGIELHREPGGELEDADDLNHVGQVLEQV